ncbi:MAG: hypothetical protein ACKPEQ_03575, partial [Dolichospermum sp.]
ATQGLNVGGFLTSAVCDTGEGNGGSITIDTSTLTLKNDGFISTSTYGKGDAGAIDITAKDSVKIDGYSDIGSDVVSGAKGNAGNIDLKAGSLSLTNGGGITSLIRGEGKGGKITIKAGDININGTYSDNNSSFSSQINTGTLGIGNAGDIDITASNITIDDQGFFGSLVYEDGEGK